MTLPLAQLEEKIEHLQADRRITRCTCGAWIYDKPTCDYPHNHKDYKWN